MVKDEYILLKSIDKWIDGHTGDLFNVTSNGNIDNEGEILKLYDMTNDWWDSLSAFDLILCKLIFKCVKIDMSNDHQYPPNLMS